MKVASERHGVHLILLLLGSAEQKTGLSEHQRGLVEFSKESRLTLVDMIQLQQSMEHGRLFVDHSHPSEEGHELIGKALYPVIKKLEPIVLRSRASSRSRPGS